jgi:hypothetical protein
MQALVDDLADEDAKSAHRAIWCLVREPEGAVLALHRGLRPVSAGEDKRLAHLIAGLNSDEFASREAAAKKLAQEKELAVPALRRALAGKPSPEVRRRAEALLAENQGRPVSSPARLRLLRGIEALEEIGTPQARELLAELARGDGEALPTHEAKAALERLAKRPAQSR